MGRPREMFFDELEAWLRELPYWESAIDEYAMAGPGSAVPKQIPTGKGRPSSLVEIKTITRVMLQERAELLRSEIRRLPPRSQEFITHHYLAKTAGSGRSMRQVCRFFQLTPEDYYAMRERALLPIIIGLYVRHADLAGPYSFCFHTEGGR